MAISISAQIPPRRERENPGSEGAALSSVIQWLHLAPGMCQSNPKAQNSKPVALRNTAHLFTVAVKFVPMAGLPHSFPQDYELLENGNSAAATVTDANMLSTYCTFQICQGASKKFLENGIKSKFRDKGLTYWLAKMPGFES